MSSSVKLYVYDLSMGLAKSMSVAYTGKQIDGIWHTSVVVYGKEFFYGQGIMITPPGQSQHGQPVETIEMGDTFLPLEVVMEYIDSQRSIFTPERYHLLDFNCNTFSNDLCQFLTGKAIPNHITDLPAEFLNTPLGQSFLPHIEGMFGRSNLNINRAPQPPTQPTPETVSLLQNVSSSALSGASVANVIQNVRSGADIDKWISEYKAVIVFFTSASCPPCRVIHPKFEELIKEKNDHPQIKILGVVADTSSLVDAAAMKYNIRATPTFQLYLNGSKYSEFKGADYAELKSQIDILLFEAYPPHPHRKVLLRSIVDQPNVPILYTTVGKLDIIYNKLYEFLEKDEIRLTSEQDTLLKQVKNYLLDKTDTMDVKGWSQLIDVLIQKLSNDHLFPILDLFRTLLPRRHVSSFYLSNAIQIANLLEIGYTRDINKATWLMILRIGCNIFSNSQLSVTHFTSLLPSSHRAQLTQLLITSLLASDQQIRQTAASLVYNYSTSIANERLEKENGTFSGTAEQEDDDWEIEVVSAIVDAFSKETDEGIVHRLLAALAKFLFLAPVDSSAGPLLSTLDIENIMNEKKKQGIMVSSKVLGISRDLAVLVQQSTQ
ncbi:PPPDE putative peptidase domain-containing protein [Pilobolus umbonatus]|nr:PPPDE putative peptidase domain-containing protein [Pilobolus umbonatus]